MPAPLLPVSSLSALISSDLMPPLPPAPVLPPGLEMLHVVGFSQLPPGLSAVTSLRELRLGRSAERFHIGEQGLAALQQLPLLRVLSLPHAYRLGDRARDRLQRANRKLQVCYESPPSLWWGAD